VLLCIGEQEGGRLNTVDFHIMIPCFVKKEIMFAISKGADINKLVQGGPLYKVFPLSKGSL
jgi:hypothetical protein